jgi:hypothetical protein
MKESVKLSYNYFTSPGNPSKPSEDWMLFPKQSEKGIEHVVLDGQERNGGQDIEFDDSIVFAVFDGATAFRKRDRLPDDVSGGYMAAKIAAECYLASYKQGLRQSFEVANSSLREEMESYGVDISDKLALWCSSIVALKITPEKNAGLEGKIKLNFEWQCLSDSLFFVKYRGENFKLLRKDNYEQDKWWLIELYNLINTNQLKGKQLPLELKEQIFKLVEINRANANESDINYPQFGHLSGEDKAVNFLQEGTFCADIDDIEEIIIISDGLIPSKLDPSKEDNFESLFEAYKLNGLRGMYEYIRGLETSDPNCTIYPRFKLSDDVSAISIKFNSL